MAISFGSSIKWLKAGALRQGADQRPQRGTPQGGVISPLLANIFLHEVLDQWFETEVKPRMKGSAHLVRYADDAVLLFERQDDAQKVLEVLPKRFGKYGLRLHPEKTRLVPFQKPPKGVKKPRPKPETFDLLGFTHYWARSRKGHWVIKRKTAKDRQRRILRAFKQWCRANRHRSVPRQWEDLSRKLRGVYAYYGIIGNVAALQSMLYWVHKLWQKWLNRRSQRGRMPWERFNQLLKAFPLPEPRRMAAV